MSLRETLSAYWDRVQGELFPWLDETLGPMTERHRQLATVLDMAQIEALVPHLQGLVGRPPVERAALARAFVAKAVFNMPTTRALIEYLKADKVMRRLCGYERAGQVPDEWTFSRAFADFSRTALPTRLHAAVILATQAERLIGHISRDSTAITAREKPVSVAAPKTAAEPKRGRGRPKKGEVGLPTEKEARRVARQPKMGLTAMLADLPVRCTVGCKRNSKGHQESWIGYKLHVDTADGGIPISCVLTSASVHDSQVAIPLATMTARRVTNLYDLMDKAYDSAEIKAHSRSLGHVPLIDAHPRSIAGGKAELEAEIRRRHFIHLPTAEDIRFHERSTAERANGSLKDNFGGRTVRVRGAPKVMAHLMFGVLALTVLQTIRLIL